MDTTGRAHRLPQNELQRAGIASDIEDVLVSAGLDPNAAPVIALARSIERDRLEQFKKVFFAATRSAKQRSKRNRRARNFN